MMSLAMRVFLVLFASSKVCGHRCVAQLEQVGHPVTIVHPETPVTNFEAKEICYWKTSYHLLFYVDNLIDLDLAASGCGGDSLVPLDITRGSSGELYVDLLQGYGNSYHETVLRPLMDDVADEPSPQPKSRRRKPMVGAFNLTTKRWHFVAHSHSFNCVLCQRSLMVLIAPFGPFIDAEKSNFTALTYFKIFVTRYEESSIVNVTNDEIATVQSALFVLLQSYRFMPESPEYYRATLDDNRLKLEYRVQSHILKSVANSPKPVSLLDKYEVIAEDVGFCPYEETTDVDGEVTVWTSISAAGFGFPEGTWQRPKNSTSDLILRRDCRLDKANYRAVWSPVCFWQPTWKECSKEEAYLNEDIYKDLLGDEVRYRHSHQLHRYTAAPITAKALKKVVAIVNREVDRVNLIDEVLSRDLVNITSNLLLDDNEDVCFVKDTRVYILVSSLTGKAPVVGLTVEFLENTDAGNVNISLDREQMSEPRTNQQFSLSISDHLASTHTRMMVFVYWIDVITHSDRIEFFAEHRKSQYIEATVALVLKSEQRAGALFYGRDSEYYVDVTFRPHSDSEMVTTITVMACTAWNNAVGGWVTAGCHTLKATRGDLVVCRCSAKYFTLVDNLGGIATARFALNKIVEHNLNASPFVEFLGDNTVLIAATILECVLSALGLCSIVCTAIFFEAWRKNTGSLILLHMILALTCNLVLGFTTSYVHLDTESIGCLVLGVLRHYSYLAMFMWMLVLSGLQLKRLTTVAGAKGINHLILKVALFAWGFPVVPITILLAWNTRFYKSDPFDRGYCYPEGLIFEVTVQAPAGIILFVNLIIFVIIVTHIFGCRGEKITRHSKNERAEQLNRLKTSIFIFFLFGFTWIFHFLSEEHVIKNEFLFEYLFLMTATTHISMLALFFIVLQERTRKDWVSFITKLVSGDSRSISVAPVKKQLPAYVPRMMKSRVRRVHQLQTVQPVVVAKNI